MKAFVWTHNALLFVCCWVFVVAGGSGGNKRNDQKKEKPSADPKKLSDPIARESKADKRTTFGDILVKESDTKRSSANHHKTLADLLEMARQEEQEKNSHAVVKGILGELLQMEQVPKEEFDKFVGDLRENEKIVEELFKPNTVQPIQELKGMLIRTFSKRKSTKVSESSSHSTESADKYQHLRMIKDTDPALSQVIEKLRWYSMKTLSGKILETALKNYLRFTIKFLAKRQRIPTTEIVPLKDMDRNRTLAALIKMLTDESRENKKRSAQSNDTKCVMSKDKSGKPKAKRLLQLFLTALEDEDSSVGSAIESKKGNKQKKRSSRRRKRFLSTFGIFLLLFAITIIISVAISKIRSSIEKCMRPATTNAGDQKNDEMIEKELMNFFGKFPKYTIPEVADGAEKAECAICKDDIEPGEVVHPLPCNANHIFHTDCITSWFNSDHNTCPFCRAKIFVKTEDRKFQLVVQPQI